ncbi:ATP-binding protein [Streptomyces sp. H34-S4]|uniref:ATP-binding protein n=1 Tax=Streptomyces sp. H34-S4 TaxID=2996463 RepID=UPI0022703830|nr:ATP-binding protein [Streptomyces sp. H34-S4]MCY0937456.1 ATP-binding protein [Streptomyces sp. H34-S4]
MNTEIQYSEGRFTARLAATASGARQARRLAVEQFAAWGLPSEDPALIVAELAANAVTHGRVPGRGFRIGLALADGVLRIEVTDTRCDRVPGIRDADGGAEAGRGLVLVDALADRWGVERGLPPSKVVWAEVTLGARGTGGRVPARPDV